MSPDPNHFDPNLPGVYLGLLPQNIHFFDGSLTKNAVLPKILCV